MHKKKLYKSIINNNLLAFFIFILAISSISFLYLSEVFEDKKSINSVISRTIAETMNSSLIKRIHVIDMVYFYKNTHLNHDPLFVNNYLKELTHHEISNLHSDIHDEFFTNIEIINNDGEVINSSNNETLGFSYSEKQFYKAFENSEKEIYWSSPSISATTQNLSTSISKKFSLGDSNYFVIGYLDLKDLNSTALETSTIGINVSLTDIYGKYIFDTNPKKAHYQEYYKNFDYLIENLNSKKSPNEWFSPLKLSSELVSISSLNGIQSLNTGQKRLVPNWYIIVSQPSNSAIGYLIQIFFISMIIMALGFLFSSINSYYFAKGIDNFLYDFNNQISLAISNNYAFQLNDIKYERFNVTANNFKNLMEHVKKQKKELSNLAYKDQLTGLYNRYYLIEFLDQHISSNKQSIITLIHIDFKDFKWINDTYNHDIGDKSIEKFALKLNLLLKNSALIARLNGDEFGIIYLENITEKELYVRFNEFIQEMKSGVNVQKNIIQMEFRGGVSIYPESAKSQHELMQFADIALEDAKKNKSKIFTYYNNTMKTKLEKKNELINEVNLAFSTNNFLLYFQPFVSLKQNEIIGFEVLLRLKDSKDSILSPFHFIPILEENGLINEVGFWVIRESFKKLEALDQQYNKNFRLSINISPIQLKSPGFLNEIKRIKEISNINPNNIDFEVTEGVLIDSYKETHLTLQSLRELGFNISLDDFGTGYSSLSYLSNLPLDKLKIDRSFMMNIQEIKQQQLFKSIISIAKNMNLEIIVEGIETIEQLEFVKQFNGNIGQGYYWSKPKPYEEIIKLLNSKKNCNP